MKEIRLTPSYKENFVNKCYSLKTMGTQLSKKEFKINNHNSINKIFKLSESEAFNKKNTIIKRENNKHLKKANNKLINIISNCMEKIKDEKNNESPITPHLAGIIGKKIYLNEQKKKNKKQVTFKDNVQRKKTKNSLNKKNNNNNNLMHLNSNRFNSKNILSEYNGNQQIKKIKTTFRFSKEKEKEIVYNITSSLISLYKPIKNYSSSNDKYKYKNPKQRRYSCSLFKLNKRNNSKRNSKEEKLRSSLSNDSKILKKSSKPKKYRTFIKSNSSKNKKLKFKNSSKNNRYISEFTLKSKTDSSSERNNLNKNFTEKGTKQKRNKKDNYNTLDWTKKFKNRENLTEGEYVDIEEDLKQKIIEYNKNELKNELNNIENTEITNLVKRLPTMKNVKNNTFTRKSTVF